MSEISVKMLEKTAVKALKELKALEVIALDVRHLTQITDTMLICTGTSNRHVKSLADNVIRHLSKVKIKPLSLEGMEDGEWVLIDLADIMVHIMLKRTREFYRLEERWDIPNTKIKTAPKSKTTPKTSSKLKARIKPATKAESKPKPKPKPKPKSALTPKTPAKKIAVRKKSG